MDLYRLYDAENQLLYIGISYSAIMRLSQHKDTQHWFSHMARMERQYLGEITRQQAEKIEADAIRAEKPAHNKMHNQGNRARERQRDYSWFCDWCGGEIMRDTGNVFLDRMMNWHSMHIKCDPIPDWATRYHFTVDRIVTLAHAENWRAHMSGKNFWKASVSEWQQLLNRGAANAKANAPTDGEGTWRRALIEQDWRKRYFVDRGRGNVGFAYPAPRGWRLVMLSWLDGSESGSRNIEHGQVEGGTVELFDDEQHWNEVVRRMARDYFWSDEDVA